MESTPFYITLTAMADNMPSTQTVAELVKISHRLGIAVKSKISEIEIMVYPNTQPADAIAVFKRAQKRQLEFE